MVLGAWVLVLGAWVLVLGAWVLVLGAWVLVLGAWVLVLGAWVLVLGAWVLVLGAWVLVLGAWLSNLISGWLFRDIKTAMFGLFKKKSEKEKLEEKYQKLLDESYRLSRTDRTAADLKAAEADKVLKQIEALEAR